MDSEFYWQPAGNITSPSWRHPKLNYLHLGIALLDMCTSGVTVWHGNALVVKGCLHQEAKPTDRVFTAFAVPWPDL